MAQIQDIPKLVKEFVELSKEYLVQETLEPAKKLGHFAGHCGQQRSCCCRSLACERSSMSSIRVRTGKRLGI